MERTGESYQAASRHFPREPGTDIRWSPTYEVFLRRRGANGEPDRIDVLLLPASDEWSDAEFAGERSAAEFAIGLPDSNSYLHRSISFEEFKKETWGAWPLRDDDSVVVHTLDSPAYHFVHLAHRASEQGFAVFVLDQGSGLLERYDLLAHTPGEAVDRVQRAIACGDMRILDEGDWINRNWTYLPPSRWSLDDLASFADWPQSSDVGQILRSRQLGPGVYLVAWIDEDEGLDGAHNWVIRLPA